MGSFYTPQLPYDINTFIDNLPVYSLTEESAQRLELMRQLQETQQYYFMGVPFPGVSDINIAASDSFQGNIIVPSLSFLIAIVGDAFYTSGPNQGKRSAEGFQLRIYDKGAKMDTVINSQFATGSTMTGLMVPPVTGATTLNAAFSKPVGPTLLDSPMVILAPGQLQLEITNISPNPVAAQVFMHFAVPITPKSTSQQPVRGYGNGN